MRRESREGSENDHSDAEAAQTCHKPTDRPRTATPLAFRPSVEGEIEQCDAERPGEKHEENPEERPAEPRVPPGEVGIHQSTTESIASAAKSSAR